MSLTDPRHQKFLDYQMTPVAQRGTQKAFAESLGVSERTLRDWRDRDDFKAAWRAAFKEVAGSVETTKLLMDTLLDDATDSELSAADRARSSKLYFDISRQIAPPEPEKESRRAVDLTDDELAALLSEAALEELKAR